MSISIFLTLCVVNLPNSLHWRHNECYGVWIHQPHDCLLYTLFRRRSKKTSKLRVTGFCAWNSPVTGEFLAQRASNAENYSIWWRHHVRFLFAHIGQSCGECIWGINQYVNYPTDPLFTGQYDVLPSGLVKPQIARLCVEIKVSLWNLTGVSISDVETAVLFRRNQRTVNLLHSKHACYMDALINAFRQHFLNT